MEFERAERRVLRVVECQAVPEWAVGDGHEALRTDVWRANRAAMQAVRLEMAGRGWLEVRDADNR